jgi:hypothetical protein
MLFLVITTPRRDPPSSVTSRRQDYWGWIKPLQKSKEVLWVAARVGRGGAALFDVKSTLKLHQYMNEWSEFMPVHFDVYPLLDSREAQAFLKSHNKKFGGRRRA